MADSQDTFTLILVIFAVVVADVPENNPGSNSCQFTAPRLAPTGISTVSLKGVERTGEGHEMRNTVGKIQVRGLRGSSRNSYK